MEITRLPTGLPVLDSKLDGGLPQGSLVIVSGGTDSVKRKFCLKIIAKGLEEAEKCVIITTKYFPDQYLKISGNLDVDASDAIFLDAASWRLRMKQNSQSDYSVSNLTDLNQLLAQILKIVDEEKEISRIYFDAITSLFLYNTPSAEQVYRFFELLSTRLRERKVLMLLSLQPGVVEGKVFSTLLYLSDGHISLKKDHNGIQFRIEDLIYQNLTVSEYQSLSI